MFSQLSLSHLPPSAFLSRPAISVNRRHLFSCYYYSTKLFLDFLNNIRYPVLTAHRVGAHIMSLISKRLF